MHTLPRSAYTLAIGLSALAGFVDAIGFMQLRGYFISFMSGNSTRLAVNLATGDYTDIALLAGILVLFVLGTMLGMLVRHAARSRSAVVGVLGFVTALLIIAALAWEAGLDSIAIACMVLAMGAENAVFQREGDRVLGLTYMTGALVNIGQRLAQAVLGGAKFSWVPYLLLWLGLISGGVIGTVLFHFLGMHSLWIAACWAGAITFIACALRHRLAS